MKNVHAWRPSKFVLRGDRWVCSPLHSELGIGSRIYAAIEVEVYQRAIATHAAGRLLDLGCGKVPLYGMYKDLTTEVVCVDWSQSLHELQHVDHFTDLNRELPFEDAAFDTILSTCVLEHIERPEILWREIARILRPGGKVILTSPFFYPIHEAPHDYHRYTGFKLRQFCEDNDLPVLELEPYGGVPEIIFDVIARHLYRHRFLVGLHLAMCRFLLSRRWVKALSADTRANFPMGYCIVAKKP